MFLLYMCPILLNLFVKTEMKYYILVQKSVRVRKQIHAINKFDIV